MKPRTLLLQLLSLPLALGVLAQEEDAFDPSAADAIAPIEPAWFTGDEVSFMDGILTPSLHLDAAFGGTTAEEQASLASGHHDPQDSATLQSIEAGLSLRAGDLQGFAVYSAYTNADEVLDGALEEGFLKVINLPFDTEIRGGQFLNRFGFQNAVHNHGWTFVDQNLVNGRFLNEGELATLGGELTWNIPVRWGPTALSMSYGGLPTHGGHDHEHGHGEEEEAEYEAEGAFFNNWLASANLVTHFDYNDFHQLSASASGAWGENEFARLSQVYGLGFQYEWRENGYEPGGRYLRWRTEAMLREIDAVSGHLHGEEDEHEHEHEGEDHDEHGEEDHDDHDHDGHDEDHHDEEGEEHHEDEEGGLRGSFDEFGFYTMVSYGWNNSFETSLRADWVSGIDEFGLDSRWRLSPAATLFLNDRRDSHFRLQYNYDHTDHFDEHSVWAQFQFSWGGSEVR